MKAAIKSTLVVVSNIRVLSAACWRARRDSNS
jgi:hypothetical protein